MAQHGNDISIGKKKKKAITVQLKQGSFVSTLRSSKNEIRVEIGDEIEI